MALDFRKVLREIANLTQDENAVRLLVGQAVDGGSLEPDKAEPVGNSSKKRLRIFGQRVSLGDLQRLGVKSGAMLRDAVRRGNIKLGRTSFRIVPSPEVRARWFAFVGGTKTQPARPFSGISSSTLTAAASEIAKSARDQLVARMKRRR